MRFLLITQNKILAHHLCTVFQECNNVLDVKYDHIETFRAYPKYKESYNPQVIILDLEPYAISLAVKFLVLVIKWAKLVPVVALTRDCWRDKVLLLQAGAMDCQNDTEDARVILARLEAISRRNYGFYTSTLKIGPFECDLKNKKFSIYDFDIKLTQFEFLIAEVLIRNHGRVLNKTEILLQFRAEVSEGKNHSFEVVISRLKQKVSRSYPVFSDVIRNIRGHGYTFDLYS